MVKSKTKYVKWTLLFREAYFGGTSLMPLFRLPKPTLGTKNCPVGYWHFPTTFLLNQQRYACTMFLRAILKQKFWFCLGQRRVPATDGDISTVRHALSGKLAWRDPPTRLREPETEEAISEESQGGIPANDVVFCLGPAWQDVGPRSLQEDLSRGRPAVWLAHQRRAGQVRVYLIWLKWIMCFDFLVLAVLLNGNLNCTLITYEMLFWLHIYQISSFLTC